MKKSLEQIAREFEEYEIRAYAGKRKEQQKRGARNNRVTMALKKIK